MSTPNRAERRRAQRSGGLVMANGHQLSTEPAPRAGADPLGDVGVWLTYCTPGGVDAQFCASMTGLLIHDTQFGYGHVMFRGGMLLSETGPRLASARNQLVRAILARIDSDPVAASHDNYILMVDSDMAFPPEAVQMLVDDIRTVDHPKPGVVGGLCFGGGHSAAMFPTVYGFSSPEDAKTLTLDRFATYPEDQLFQCHATGAAFTLLSVEMLRDMATKFDEPVPWYAETVRAKTDREYGEDIVFCLRAGAMGYGIFVDSRVKIDHYKRGKLNEDVYMERMAIMGGLVEAMAEIEVTPEGELVQVGD